jgi:hypothetical protein
MRFSLCLSISFCVFQFFSVSTSFSQMLFSLCSFLLYFHLFLPNAVLSVSSCDCLLSIYNFIFPLNAVSHCRVVSIYVFFLCIVYCILCFYEFAFLSFSFLTKGYFLFCFFFQQVLVYRFLSSSIIIRLFILSYSNFLLKCECVCVCVCV